MTDTIEGSQAQPEGERQEAPPLVGAAATRALSIFAVIVAIPSFLLFAFLAQWGGSDLIGGVLLLLAATILAIVPAFLSRRRPRTAAIIALCAVAVGLFGPPLVTAIVVFESFRLMLEGSLGMVAFWGLPTIPLLAVAVTGFISARQRTRTGPSPRKRLWAGPLPWLLTAALALPVAGHYELEWMYAPPVWLYFAPWGVAVLVITGALLGLDWPRIGSAVAAAAVLAGYAPIVIYTSIVQFDANDQRDAGAATDLAVGLLVWTACLIPVLVGVVLAAVQARRRVRESRART